MGTPKAAKAAAAQLSKARAEENEARSAAFAADNEARKLVLAAHNAVEAAVSKRQELEKTACEDCAKLIAFGAESKACEGIAYEQCGDCGEYTCEDCYSDNVCDRCYDARRCASCCRVRHGVDGDGSDSEDESDSDDCE